jgi:hypothetical protein
MMECLISYLKAKKEIRAVSEMEKDIVAFIRLLQGKKVYLSIAKMLMLIIRVC